MKTYLPKFLILLLVVLPLLAPIRPDLGWFYTSPEILKTFFGVVGVLFVLVLWLIFSYNKSEIQIRRSNIYLPLFIFISWCYITLLWVEDGYLATVMLAQFTSSALVFFLMINLVNKKIIDLTMIALIVSMTLVSIVGLLQNYLIDSVFIQNLFGQSAAPGSTFANKNMASHFLVMVLPLSLFFSIKSNQKNTIVFYAIATTIALWYLVFIAARQAYLAFGIELFLLIVFIILDYIKNKKLSIYATIDKKKYKLFVIATSLVFLLVISNINIVSINNTDKLNQVQSIGLNAGSGRFPAWINTIELIKENALIGVGVGQWPEAYPKYYDSIEKDVIFNEKTKLKRLHNDYLEMFSNVGIVGFLLLIWIAILVLHKFFRIILNSHHPNRFRVFSLGLGLSGFCVVAFFSFPVRVYLPAFLVLVYFALIEISYKKSYEFYKIKNGKKILLTLIVVSIIALYVGERSIKWIKAENYHFLAKSFLKSDMSQYASVYSDMALKNNPLSPNFYFTAGVASFFNKDMDKAELLLKKSIDISPFNTQALLSLAIVYNTIGNSSMEKKVLDFIISFDKRNVLALSGLIRVLYKEKKFKQVTILYQRLKDSFLYFNKRSGFGPYHDVVGVTAVSLRDYDYAEYIYQDAINKAGSAPNYVKLATVKFYHSQKAKEGIELYKKAIAIDPNIPKNKEIKELIENYESSTE